MDNLRSIDSLPQSGFIWIFVFTKWLRTMLIAYITVFKQVIFTFICRTTIMEAEARYYVKQIMEGTR